MDKETEEFLNELVFFLDRIRKSLIAVFIFAGLFSFIPSSITSFNLQALTSGTYVPFISYVMKHIQYDMFNYTRFPFSTLATLTGVYSVKPLIIASGWFDTFTVSFYMALLIGIVFSSPYIAYQIGSYISPALYPHEKRKLYKYTILFTILFTSGIVYGYRIIMPLTYLILLWITVNTGASPVFTLNSFYSTFFIGLLSTGIFFTYPIILKLLIDTQIIQYNTLRQKWREITIAILIITAIITPDPTPITMTLLSAPFLTLYLLTLLLTRKNINNKKTNNT